MCQDCTIVSVYCLYTGGKTPFGQLPILEVDGVVIAQSGTIIRYVAEELGKYQSQYFVQPCNPRK